MASHVVQLASKASEASVTGLPSLLDAVKGRTCGDWLPALPSSWQQAIYQSGERYSFSDIIRAYVPCMPGVLIVRHTVLASARVESAWSAYSLVRS